MDSFSSICSFLPEALKPILHLDEIADTLFTEMASLRDIKGDVESHLVALETPQVKRSSQVESWMQEVDSLDQEVTEFEESFLRRTVGCTPFGPLPANYHLGTAAIDLLRGARDLKVAHGSFTSLVDQPQPEMEPQVSSSISIVGAGAVLSVIREHLCDDDVKVLGIFGMGGIGKTTLLSKVRDEMRSQFDLVIWVTVSREVNASNIRKTIRDQIGLSHSESLGETRVALSGKKVLLILDDMWARLDLESVGVPLENKWKIAITTRSEQVCISMGAQHKIKVPLLDESESWELFREKVGTEVDIDSEPILPLAKTIVAKCGGLPLALVTVGRAMVDATTTGKWEEALENLRNSPNEIRGMQDLYTLLKFSYDGLENDTLRHCLLLCSLFAEDFDIFIQDLVSLWIGSGILNGIDGSTNSARNKGLNVVNKLKSACLLESGSYEERHVKLHDGVRDMILWISSGDCGGDQAIVLLSYAGLGLTQFPSTKRWGEATWISISSNEIEQVPNEIPTCPNLLVLNMSENHSLSKLIPYSFLTFMPILRVLKLSETSIGELPKSIDSLVELQYLDLSWSSVNSLPEEIGNLAKLRILDLWGTKRLTTVPRQSILNLSSLQELNIASSSYTWDIGDDSEEDLDSLRQLEDLGLTVENWNFLEKLLSSPLWSKAMGYLTLKGNSIGSFGISRVCKVMESLLHFDIYENDKLEELTFSSYHLKKLKFFRLWDLDQLTKISVRKEENDPHLLPSLCDLEIWYCPKLENIHGVSDLSALTELDLRECPRIEDLIEDGSEEKEAADEYVNLLPNLIYLRLEKLHKLRSISKRLLLLPSLEFLHVYHCPKLKKLPFGNDSAKKIKLIQGAQKWWDELEWEDNIRLTFFPHYSSSPDEVVQGRDQDDDDDDNDEDVGEDDEDDDDNDEGDDDNDEGDDEDDDNNDEGNDDNDEGDDEDDDNNDKEEDESPGGRGGRSAEEEGVQV